MLLVKSLEDSGKKINQKITMCILLPRWDKHSSHSVDVSFCAFSSRSPQSPAQAFGTGEEQASPQDLQNEDGRGRMVRVRAGLPGQATAGA